MNPYVTGQKGRYEIQVPVEHLGQCLCEKCAALPDEERVLPHTHRLRRASPFPDNRTETSKYAGGCREEVAQRPR